MKILNKKILNKAATFLLTAVLLCCNAVQVEAYTDINGYPFLIDGMTVQIANRDSFLGVLKEQNSYFFDFGDNVFQDEVNLIFGNGGNGFVFPYFPDLYDYYIVGTYAFDNLIACNEYSEIMLYGFSDIGEMYGVNCADVNFYDYSSAGSRGQSFSAKLNFDFNTNINLIVITNGLGPVCGGLWFSASIIPVKKDAAQSDANATILQKLIEINQNLVTSNSLQQSTIDAINQHDANEKSWFQQLIQNMGLGFSALYKQMTEEKDEQLYGYQDTTTSEAASAFSSESDKLTALEGELSTQSNTYVTDYAAEGFDLGVLATIGSSLIFVTTWFTNFWNMGGVFTACLNFCFALSIVFFILRIKR